MIARYSCLFYTCCLHMLVWIRFGFQNPPILFSFVITSNKCSSMWKLKTVVAPTYSFTEFVCLIVAGFKNNMCACCFVTSIWFWVKHSWLGNVFEIGPSFFQICFRAIWSSSVVLLSYCLSLLLLWRPLLFPWFILLYPWSSLLFLWRYWCVLHCIVCVHVVCCARIYLRFVLS